MKSHIICSIGPSTESKEMIEKMINEGMTIARMNFSHDTHESHGMRIDRVRDVAKRLGKKVLILCDLQGPKIRVRDFENAPRKITAGEKVVLTTSVCKAIKPGEIVIEDPYLHGDVKVGDVILLDDGMMELVVDDATNHKIMCTVIVGGDLYPRKGVNLPLTKTTTSSLTDKDLKDLEFVLTKDPEWIAISFVQTKDDVARLRKLIGKSKAKIMCKIERANAIENIHDIIKEADGIMVARGDLGVEIPMEKVPLIQKRIIRYCNDAQKPVVTATHMLASMVKNAVSTRAEVSDIANAILDGSDAVMMSNETTIGQYPLEALKTMAKVTRETENFLYEKENLL